MSKVMGIIMAILGFIVTVVTIFLTLNSSVYLRYNPATPPARLSDVGLVLPYMLGLGLFIAGVTFLLLAKEPNELRE